MLELNRLGKKDIMESHNYLEGYEAKLEGLQSLDFSYNEMGSTLARFSGKSKFLRNAQLAEKSIHW